jgi:hypothetical protein
MDQTGCIFEKLAFINVFHSSMSRSISYGLAVAGGSKSVKLGKLLHVWELFKQCTRKFKKL